MTDSHFGGVTLKIAKKVVQSRIWILIISVILLVISIFGYYNTRINYDILSYLPKEIDTMKGQEILKEEFHKGGFAFEVIQSKDSSKILSLQNEIEHVDGVESVISFQKLTDNQVPSTLIPEKWKDYFEHDDATLLAIFFKDSTSSDQTIHAVDQIRQLSDDHMYLSGMSALIYDIEQLSKQEMTAYVAIAVVLTSIVLAIFMESYMIPVLFMASIGLAIIFNLGSNYFLHEISYITKSLSAVLQLGVTLDYSIFLWHSYMENRSTLTDKQEAMAKAIVDTFKSVVGGSTTTIAGFIALCFMTFTLGKDMGIVMAKGVLLGVISCVTILPSFILVFDRWIEKTTHKPIRIHVNHLSKNILKHWKIVLLCFLIVLPVSYFGYSHLNVYYNLDQTLPKSLLSIQANQKLDETFHMNATHMILVDNNVPENQKREMFAKIEQLDGVKFNIGLPKLIGPMVPEDMVVKVVGNDLESENHQLWVVQSAYQTASDEVGKQIEQIKQIVHEYDKTGLVIGEAPATYDLIQITDHDFKVVNAVSIGLVFLIILFTFQSLSIPLILLAVIEFAIFVNMSIPYYTNTSLPFIASIVVGTIQLGATVDYAILMTNRYLNERKTKSKYEAIQIALETSIPSILVSAFGFFAATFGVKVYSHIDMISSLCGLLSRGAICSMIIVICVLPTMLWIFDGVILKTTRNVK